MIRKLKWVIGSDISHTFPCNYWSKRLSPIFLMRVVLVWIIVYKAKKLCCGLNPLVDTSVANMNLGTHWYGNIFGLGIGGVPVGG